MQTIEGAAVLPPEQVGHGTAAHRRHEAKEADLVGEGPDRRGQGREQVTRPAQRIADTDEPAARADHRARLEGAQGEGGDVELRGHLGVGREQDLEAPVEDEAVDEIAPHPSADTVGRLEHEARPAGVGDRPRAAQTGQTGADDHDVDVAPRARAAHDLRSSDRPCGPW